MLTIHDNILKQINDIREMDEEMNQNSIDNSNKSSIIPNNEIVDSYINIMNIRNEKMIDKSEVVSMLKIIKNSKNNIHVIME